MSSDENTRLMIQLATLMMQNSSRDVQPSSEALTMPTTLTPVDIKKECVEIAPMPNPHNISADQTLAVQFAKQLLANSTRGGMQVPLKRPAVAKPATIAQIMQTQCNKKSPPTLEPITTSACGDQYILLQNGSTQNGFAGISVDQSNALVNSPPSTNGVRDTKHIGGGPIRHCRKPARFRPGIDNYGRLEAIATPGVIMHAMELMRQKDKKKRGPKEKETFAIFMYCLPDKNSKLPKFSSLDPMERSLVDKHQTAGYGYPAQDYINGIPRKTQICLAFSAEKFHTFMLELYPALEGRLYDMYRIDKTRRLIRIEVKCPRHLKDMKYQGTVIIIPYEHFNDRPANIIHRNFDDGYTMTSAANEIPPSLIDKMATSLTSLPPELIAETEVSNERKPNVQDFTEDQSTATGNNVSMILHTIPQVPITEVGQGERHSLPEGPVQPDTDCGSDSDKMADDDVNVFEHVKILTRVGEIRGTLKPTKRVHIRPESIVADMVAAYRHDSSLEQHRLAICFQLHQFPNGIGIQHDEDVEAGSVIVMFWEEVFRKHFTGSQDRVAVLEPTTPEDTYSILGRILYHGLVIDNYLPVKFSPACLNYMLTGECSDRLLLTSLYRLMSESEKEALETAMDEVRLGVEVFSPHIEDRMKVILGKYGCQMLPSPCNLDTSMTSIARTYLIYKVYWILMQMKTGLSTCGEVFADVTEDDLVALYQVLTPTVPAVLERVVYMLAAETISESESLVKGYWEQYLYSLSKTALSRLLYQWCGYDCLCVGSLYVKFSSDRDFKMPLFSPRQGMICLPGVCTSVEELRYHVENQLPAGDVTDT